MTQESKRPWTARELRLLRENRQLGADALGALLGRSPRAVRSMAQRQFISLRRPGERRGLAMGQPRGERWALTDRETERAARRLRVLAELRQKVVGGEVDPERLIRMIDAMIGNGERPLCPACARAPQEKNGVCRACYLDGLTAAYIERTREEDARRTNDRERQRRNVQQRGTWRQRRRQEGQG